MHIFYYVHVCQTTTYRTVDWLGNVLHATSLGLQHRAIVLFCQYVPHAHWNQTIRLCHSITATILILNTIKSLHGRKLNETLPAIGHVIRGVSMVHQERVGHKLRPNVSLGYQCVT